MIFFTAVVNKLLLLHYFLLIFKKICISTSKVVLFHVFLLIFLYYIVKLLVVIVSFVLEGNVLHVSCFLLQDLLTETCSTVSTASEDTLASPRTYENDDSDYSDYDTDDSFQEFKLKDWLKLAKTLVRKHETPENKSKLLGKYDELQDFFYFFAVEYFTGDQNVTELVSSKRREFVAIWHGIIGPCDFIFDFLLDLMDDINAENSFRL